MWLRAHRRSPRTCALWARIFEGPGQTGTGWPKKVSRRAQAVRARRMGREAEGDRFGPSLQGGLACPQHEIRWPCLTASRAQRTVGCRDHHWWRHALGRDEMSSWHSFWAAQRQENGRSESDE